MQNGLNLQELLASEITRAALRADGLALRDFKATLETAAQRLQARGGDRRSRRPASDWRAAAPCVALPCFGA